MWHAPVGPSAAPLIPVFLGQRDVPPEYGPHRYLTEGESARFLDPRKAAETPNRASLVSQGAESARSAFYVFKRLMHLAFQQPDPILTLVNGKRFQSPAVTPESGVVMLAHTVETGGTDEFGVRGNGAGHTRG
jgi:hypothetical protein